MRDTTLLARLRKSARMQRSTYCAGEVREIIEQGDAALWANLLDGVTYDPAAFSDEGERVGDLTPGTALYAMRAPIQRRYDHALRALLVGAPAWVEKAVALRESITTLCLRGAAADAIYGLDLSTLQGFPRLERLLVRGAARIEDLAPLSLAASLRAVHFEDSEVADLGALGDCAQIESLDLDSLAVADFSLLSKMASLRTLRVRQVGALRSLGALGALPALESLTLDKVVTGGEGVTSLAALAGARSLKTLHIQGLSKLTDVTALATLPSLEALSLTDATSLTDLAPLASCGALRAVDLRGCASVTDVTALAGATGLRALLLAGTKTKMSAVPEGLRAVTNHRKDETIRHALTEDRRVQAKAARPEGLHLAEWPTWPKLEALLFGREPDNADLGVELTAALDDARLYDAMLYGVRWKAPAQAAKQMRLDADLTGLALDESSELPRSPTALRDRVLRALIDMAPEGCASARALRESATAVVLDGLFESREGELDAGPVGRMPNVTKLAIVRAKEVKRFEAVAACERLEWLTVQQVRAVDLTAIDRMPGIKHLALVNVPADLPSLVGREALETLGLHSVGQVGYGQPAGPPRAVKIGASPRLRSLNMSYASTLSDVAVFDCPALTEIVMVSLWNTTITLSGLASLRSLELSSVGDKGSLTVDALDALESLTLRSVNVDLHAIFDALRGSRTLRSVELQGYRFPLDLALLAAIPSLRSVSVTYRNGLDLTPLAAATGLESLDITGCSVPTGVAVLESLPKLTALKIHGSGIKSASLSPRLQSLLLR